MRQTKLKIADNLRLVGDEWLMAKAVLIGILIGMAAFIGYRLLTHGLAAKNPRDEIIPMLVALMLAVGSAVLVVLIRAIAIGHIAERCRRERGIAPKSG